MSLHRQCYQELRQESDTKEKAPLSECDIPGLFLSGPKDQRVKIGDKRKKKKSLQECPGTQIHKNKVIGGLLKKEGSGTICEIFGCHWTHLAKAASSGEDELVSLSCWCSWHILYHLVGPWTILMTPGTIALTCALPLMAVAHGVRSPTSHIWTTWPGVPR